MAEKKEDGFKFGGVGVFMACPFTNLQVSAVSRTEDNFYQYDLMYNNNNYTIRLGDLDLVKASITESNKWVFQAMLFNNEWQIDKETIITPTLIEHIVRLADYPRDFESKCDYYLLKCYKEGGAVVKNISYKITEYLKAYCIDEDEFNRVLKLLKINGNIAFQYQTIDKGSVSFEEKGLIHAKELLRIEKEKKPRQTKPGLHPNILIITTDTDRLYLDRLRNFLDDYEFAISHTEPITDDKNGATFNTEKLFEDENINYVIFIKSQSSESNKNYLRVENTAMQIHKRTERNANSFLYFAAIDDGPFNFPSHYAYYDNRLYDFRIISNRRRIVADILEDWNRQLTKTTKKTGEIPEGKKIFSFPPVILNKDDEYWLNVAYSNFKENKGGREPSYSRIISRHWNKLPRDYDPTLIDTNLLQGGSLITFYGIWTIDPYSNYIKGVEDTIFAIKSILEKDGNDAPITDTMLSRASGYGISELIDFIVLLSRFDGLFKVIQLGDAEFKIQIPDIKTMNLYRDFKSLEDLLKDALSVDKDNVDHVIPKEIETLESKTDFNVLHAHKTSFSMRNENIEPAMGVADLASDLAQIIDDLPEEKGQMVGIFGRWGRGKTYLIEQIKKVLSLKKDKEYIWLTYHAWKYQEAPASWAYLYELFAKNYLNKGESFFGGYQYWKRLLKLNTARHGKWPIYSYLFLVVFTLAFSIMYSFYSKTAYSLISIPIVVLYVLKDTYKEYSIKAIHLIKKYSARHSYKESLGIQADIQDEIIKLLKVWIPYSGTKRKKIILIVEDTDRCTEDKIIQNIDALRVMLEDEEICKRLIIVAPIDERILKNAIHIKYLHLFNKTQIKENIAFDIKELTSEYLDKIFISAIKLGILTEEQKQEFLFKLLNKEVDEKTINQAEDLKIRNEMKKSGTTVSGDDVEYVKFHKEYLRSNADSSDIPDQMGKLNLDILSKDGSSVAKGGDFILRERNGNITSIPEIKKAKDERVLFQNQFSKLTANEIVTLSEITKKWTDATPRKIRIFYYRYLLCKNLLISKYSKNGRANPWQNEPGLTILMETMLYYINRQDSELISKTKKEMQDSNEAYLRIPGIESAVPFTKTNCVFLLEILELVIAY